MAYPHPPRSEKGPTEYEKLKRFLLTHRGHFALGLVRINSPFQRDGVIAALRDDLLQEGLELKKLDYSQRQLPSLYEELRRDSELTRLLSQHAQEIALAIVGLEGSIELPPRPGSQVPLFLATLNLQRDNLAITFPIPITLWLSDYAMDRLAHGAPDFFDFFGALFTFRLAPAEAAISRTEEGLSVPMSIALPRQAHTEELIDLLQDRLNELQRRREQLTTMEKQRLAEVLEQLGEAYLSFRDKGAAVSYFREASRLYNELGDKSKEAEFLTRLAEAYTRSYQWSLAIDSYKQALPIYQEIGARLGEANTIKALGDVHRLLAQYEQARQRYEQALPIYQEIGARLGEANTIKALGDVHRLLAQYEQAQHLYHIALAMSREIKDRYTAAWTLYRIGLTYAAQGQTDLAEQVLEEAIALFEEIKIPRGVEASRNVLSRIAMPVSQVAEPTQGYETGSKSKPEEE
ncbi:MAG: tetratricopeptide repeat protein [Chloroflexi bacterium]|nr:tetratricopeptide repeat protein [Chloroflexota bacterium]